jgi:hypothetical protein
MMKTLLVASLLSVSFTAGAVPTPPDLPHPPPMDRAPAAACSDSGGVLFEIDQKIEMNSPLEDMPQTSELELYEGGKWTLTKGKQTSSGCLSKQQMKTISDDLARADWKFAIAEAACAAISSSYTQYSSHGKVVWSQHMCQLEYLNDKSRRSLDEIEKILVTASTPKLPPCCKK